MDKTWKFKGLGFRPSLGSYTVVYGNTEIYLWVEQVAVNNSGSLENGWRIPKLIQEEI